MHNWNVVGTNHHALTPYESRFKEPAKHLPLPFGCLVTVREPKEKQTKGKFEARGDDFIYLGAYTNPGGIPDGSC